MARSKAVPICQQALSCHPRQPSPLHRRIPREAVVVRRCTVRSRDQDRVGIVV
jgi:hypothetical protein